jgi:hypothetical protein
MFDLHYHYADFQLVPWHLFHKELPLKSDTFYHLDFLLFDLLLKCQFDGVLELVDGNPNNRKQDVQVYSNYKASTEFGFNCDTERHADNILY